ncbi:MAG: ThuA domain-containing protein [Armatimonadetes bacterium]|nr:ThuA domain-containing protein [Armatimonadota bacterium]
MKSRTVFYLLPGVLAIALAMTLSLLTPASARPARKRILVVNHAAGFRHGAIDLSKGLLKEWGEQTGLWEVEYASTAEEVAARITEEGLKPFQAIMFDNATGELPITSEGEAALLKWIRSGRGFIGTHAATDALYQWPEYGKLIGGYFNGHPWTQEVIVKVEDRKHPSTRELPESFKITDEIYQFRDWSRNDLRVLMSLDNASIDTGKGGRDDKDYAVAWVRNEGKGRVFYTSLGHIDDVWRNPLYRKHLIGGIKWALGLAKGDARPIRKP